MLSKKMDIGLVYCITSVLVNFTKIGVTRNSLQSLKKRYHTYYGNDLKLEVVATLNPFQLEKMAHKHFYEYKLSKELFKKENFQQYINYLNTNKISVENFIHK